MVLPVPVGDSSIAFYFPWTAFITFSMYSCWQGYGSEKGNQTSMPLVVFTKYFYLSSLSNIN